MAQVPPKDFSPCRPTNRPRAQTGRALRQAKALAAVRMVERDLPVPKSATPRVSLIDCSARSGSQTTPLLPRTERTKTSSSATTTQMTTALSGCFSVRIATSLKLRNSRTVSASNFAIAVLPCGGVRHHHANDPARAAANPSPPRSYPYGLLLEFSSGMGAQPHTCRRLDVGAGAVTATSGRTSAGINHIFDFRCSIRVNVGLGAAVRRFHLVACALAAAAAMAAPARADDDKPLRFVPHADLTIIDPYFSGVYITRNYGYMVYDTLFALDHEFRPHPQMVDSWEASDDGLTWEFTLRAGLKYHDGQPVRAADAVASLKRWGQRTDSYGQALLDAAAAIEALDDTRFRIALKRPFPRRTSRRIGCADPSPGPGSRSAP